MAHDEAAGSDDSNPIAARLASVRAARSKLRAERDTAEAAGADAAALASEERALRDDSAIFEAERKHGKQGEKIAVVKGVGAKECDVVIVKRPNAVTFKGFQDLEEPKLLDVEKLVGPCVIYPSLEVFDRIHSVEQPGVLLRAADAVAYLAGVRKAVDQGKAKS